MSMRIHLNHCCLTLILSMWPPCHSVHFCSSDGKHILEYTSKFTVLGYEFWQDMFCIPCFWHRPNAKSVKQASQVMDGLSVRNESTCKHSPEDMHGNLCYGIIADWAEEDVTRFAEMFPWLCITVHSYLLYTVPHFQRHRDHCQVYEQNLNVHLDYYPSLILHEAI
jgi:hypothetical protein